MVIMVVVGQRSSHRHRVFVDIGLVGWLFGWWIIVCLFVCLLFVVCCLLFVVCCICLC